MKTIIKWPGGKSREIDQIRDLIPNYDRYIEPFFGGGAVFFDLMPKSAMINDISDNLMNFYDLIKKQDEKFHDYLLKYDKIFTNLIKCTHANYSIILNAYKINEDKITEKMVTDIIEKTCIDTELILNKDEYKKVILKNVIDKFRRTRINNENEEFNKEDLEENLITGFTSGFYMYFRNVYNDINLNRVETNLQYQIANFYFIREYCYGSMFRYNKNGEFNIPYGGMSYNKKDFKKKIDAFFNEEITHLFKNANIYNLDFEDFFNEINLTQNDFIFLDPPYDTDFSDYEGRSFDLDDQYRLCEYLKSTSAKFILIIKNTDYIYNLYKDDFNILSFNKSYTYNVRSRNNRNVKHLIISNF